MSSFKRKAVAKPASTYPGTRASPASLLTVITSTGIPSLDDILGGGLPLSCSLLIAAPDLHSSYGELAQKYFIAQGLSCGHDLCIVEDNAEEFVKDIMWIPKSAPSTSLDGRDVENLDEEAQKIKIAWRYENMKQFQTTVTSSSSSLADEYCNNFDLSCRVPHSVVEGGIRSGQLSFIAIQSSDPGRNSTSHILDRIAHVLKPEEARPPSSSTPLRVCIPSLGSPQWGELTNQDILHFLHSLRSLLRRHPYACASVSLPPHLSTDTWRGHGWVQKLGWVSDAALTLSAFSADPSLLATFPSHHGLLHIHTLPAPHTLVPPSDKFSTLRGLSASSTGGSGENNLTFKCTRKRLIVETLHLDIEGGVGERRTTPSNTVLSPEPGRVQDPVEHQTHKTTAFATIGVELEDMELEKPAGDGDVKVTEVLEIKPKKAKKKVAFRSDRPDLYDF